MPQLDKFSFASQIFWLCTFFCLFYFISLNYVLPDVLRVLRLRSSKLNFFKSSVRRYFNEESLVLISRDFLVSKQLISSEKTFLYLEKSFLNWFERCKNFLYL